MKKIILLTATLLVSFSAFACDCEKSKANQAHEKLGSALKSQKSDPAKPAKQDISMVYGGEDISRKFTMANIAFA